MYICTEEDKQYIDKLREDNKPVNPVMAGQILPGIVVAEWGETCKNVSVFLDGQIEPLWKTSISEGNIPGSYLNV
ncbi:hypothetical protein [Tenacibaculum sp.]|uniref:hypothetical protein n=1 Tax=Tenacibaculum sp. TaxID=1906242 RepID=UPI003D0CB285